MVAHKKNRFSKGIRNCLFAICSCCIGSSGHAQFDNFTTLWQHEILTQSIDTGSFFADHLQFDHAGNLITIGYFLGMGTLDGTTVIENYEGIWDYNPFIIKQDVQGEILWSRPLIESGDCHVSTLTVDADNHIYLGGHLSGVVDFDPGTGEILYGEEFLSQWFVMKLSPSGDIMSIYSGQSSRGILDLVEDEGYLYAAGLYSNSADIDPGPAENIIHCSDSDSAENLFLLKMNLSGEVIWAKADTIGHVSRIQDIFIGPQNEIVLSGYYVFNFDPDYSDAGTFLPSAGNHTNFYSATYSSEGDFLNVVYGENLGNSEYVRDATIDSQGNLYLLGELSGVLDLDPTPDLFMIGDEESGDDIFLLKYSPERELIWAHTVGTDDDDGAYSLHLDSDHNCYAGGASGTGNIQMDNQGPVLGAVSAGYTGLLLKINANGTFGDIKTIGQGGYCGINDMTWTSAGRMAFTMSYDSNIDPAMTGFQPLEDPTGDYNSVIVCFDTQIHVKEISALTFSIFPNPNNGKFRIASEEYENQLMVRISDSQGQIVLEKKYSGYLADIDAVFAEGVYQLEVKTEKSQSIQRIIVLR